jgi:hypothetical protein
MNIPAGTPNRNFPTKAFVSASRAKVLAGRKPAWENRTELEWGQSREDGASPSSLLRLLIKRKAAA